MMKQIFSYTLAACMVLAASSTANAQNFNDPEEYARQLEQLSMQPKGPKDQPWAQYLVDETVDTAKFKKDGPYTVCFSNAGVNNPWRVVGFTNMTQEVALVDTAKFKKDGPYTVCFSNAGVNNPWRVVGFTNMTQEVALHPEIGNFVHVDAEGSDDKQIADIADLLASGNCDILIVSPNTTAALTPAVEAACEKLPVIVFDRGVQTDCPVTFIHPIGGYGFGIQGARFIADNVESGSNVLML
ncbi:substrate-binding domain-containing protein, partial [Paramesorhizobium deserti]|uniref:substrate-binding domain-containing protein n=1 Tax=Paramesorhizobium deserti TaxID=1494590 RepID=UPI000A6718EB